MYCYVVKSPVFSLQRGNFQKNQEFSQKWKFFKILPVPYWKNKWKSSASNPGLIHRELKISSLWLIEWKEAFSYFITLSTPDYKSGREDCKILTLKVNFLCQKSSESFQFFSLKNIKSGSQLILMKFFVYCHFWSTLFTKIGPKFQTLISNCVLI